jgi:hypothetical protein
MFITDTGCEQKDIMNNRNDSELREGNKMGTQKERHQTARKNNTFEGEIFVYETVHRKKNGYH